MSSPTPAPHFWNLHPTASAAVDFVFHAFSIINRRSNFPAGSSDTVKISVSLTVDGVAHPSLFRDMGDLGDTERWYGVDLKFSNVNMTPSSDIVMGFVIMNSGHKDSSKVQQVLQQGTDALVKAAAGSIPSTGLWGVAGTAGGLILKGTVDAVLGLVTANCDGIVAADAYEF